MWYIMFLPRKRNSLGGLMVNKLTIRSMKFEGIIFWGIYLK